MPLRDAEWHPAVQLFVARAARVSPSFTLDAHNGDAVALLCGRLDGLPLAIELAAARVKVLSVEEIAARLGDRFRLLKSGTRTALPILFVVDYLVVTVLIFQPIN